MTQKHSIGILCSSTRISLHNPKFGPPGISHPDQEDKPSSSVLTCSLYTSDRDQPSSSVLTHGRSCSATSTSLSSTSEACTEDQPSSSMFVHSATATTALCSTFSSDSSTIVRHPTPTSLASQFGTTEPTSSSFPASSFNIPFFSTSSNTSASAALSQSAPLFDQRRSTSGPTMQADLHSQRHRPSDLRHRATLLLRHLRLSQRTLVASDFQLEGVLGRGAFATVYAAAPSATMPLRAQLPPTLALKVMRTDTPSRRRAARREARLLRRVAPHWHVVPLLGALRLPCARALVLPHLVGPTLQQGLEAVAGSLTECQYDTPRGLQLPTNMALRLGAQLATALERLHGDGVAHRDLKPDNILLEGLVSSSYTDGNGNPRNSVAHSCVAGGNKSTGGGFSDLGSIDNSPRIRLIDFGLACRFRRGGMHMRTRGNVGSPMFAAPEVWSGHAYKADLADVYSLGAVLVAMLLGYKGQQGAREGYRDDELQSGLTGKPQGEDSGIGHDAAQSRLHSLWKLDELGNAERFIVDMCLQTRPERRPSAREVRLMLEAASEAVPHDHLRWAAWVRKATEVRE